MKHGIKRWLCLFLTAVMLMSLFPAAYAAETEDEAEPEQTELVEIIPDEPEPPAEPEIPDEPEKTDE